MDGVNLHFRDRWSSGQASRRVFRGTRVRILPDPATLYLIFHVSRQLQEGNEIKQ